MSGGGRILEQDDPFADLVPAKPQSSGEVDPFHDLVPKDPFHDLVPRKALKLEQPPAAATDATRVGPEPVGLEEQLRNQHPDLLTATVQGFAGMVEHPIDTGIALAKTPFEGGKAVGEYTEGGHLHPGKGRAAAIGALQTAAMLGTGPAERLAEPVVERAIGSALAPFATRTAIGAATGATFTPDRPAVGAILGAAGGAISSRGAAAAKLQERIARFEALSKEHPDWLTEQPSTPAEAITNTNRVLENPNRPKATATMAEAEPQPTEPDFTADPAEVGPFKAALVEHGKQFVDELNNPPAPTSIPDNASASARTPEQLRQQESDLFNQQVEANRAAGWPEPSPDALEHFGDGALEISHEETARELWMHASDHFTVTEALQQGVTGRKKDELERVARSSDDAYNAMLSQYEDYFGPEGVQKFLAKTGLPGDLTGGIESIPDARDFNDRISTGEPPSRANPAGVPGLVDKVDKTRAPAAADVNAPSVNKDQNAVKPAPPKKLEAAVKSPFGVVVSVPGKSLHLDPDRFQFKHQGIDAKSGAGAWVKGAKRYNPVLGGVWVTWIDPADGKEYVVNSHHRKAIYDNDITPDRPANVNVLRIEAGDATEARAIGARINIAEGHGTPLDVAQFIRDSGLQASDLEKEGISLRGDLARQGSALAQLTPDLLAKVGTGELAENHGVSIGEMLAGKPELQREVVAEVKRSGRRLSADDVREVARQVDAAGTADVRQETLFGGEVGRRPLFIERAQLATSILKKLGQDRRILGFVAQEQRAQILAKGGNVIDVEKSRELADQSGQLEELFERLYTREGPIAKVLTQAASRVAHGQKVKAVADDIYSAVADAVQSEISRGTGSGESDRSAEGSRGVQSSPAETGEVTQEKVELDPNQEGFSLGEPQMRPETEASYKAWNAKRKSTWLDAFRESKSVDKASTAAGISPSTVAVWRKTDPDFAAAAREIREPKRVAGKLKSAPAKPKPMNPAELKSLVDRLREQITAMGGLVNSRHLRSFNQEAAAIVKRLAGDGDKARSELEELADDFTPITGLEEEQKQLHAQLIEEERRAAKQREMDMNPEAVAHRERQKRYAEKQAAAAAPDVTDPYVLLYREAKALREVKPAEGVAIAKKVTQIIAEERKGYAGMTDERKAKINSPEGQDELARELLSTEAGRAQFRKQWEAAVDKAAASVKEPKYDYASTQINLPSKAAAAIKSFAAKIPDADLAAEGREDEPHITVKYGLHGTDPEVVRKLLATEAPFTVNLEATSYFPNGESGSGDVLKVDVDSPALHALNKKIAAALPNTETHPTYKPHATIAYLKPGLGKKYSGNGTFMGRTVRVTSVVFSDKNGEQTRIKLGGKEQPQVVIFDKHGFMESKTPHEIDTIGNGHHSQTFSKQALDIQDNGVLAYMNREGEVTVNVAANAEVSDKRIRAVLKEHWPQLAGKDVTIIRQNAGINEDSVVEDFRVWEQDMFGYSAGPESLFPDAEAGKAGPPKPTDGGFEAKAKEARDKAAFLKKQLTRMQKSLENFDHSASANNRPANDLARNIDALRKEIAELERIANFAEKLTTEEIKLRSEGEGEGGAGAIDLFGVREGEQIQPNKLTALVMQLEELTDQITSQMADQERMLAKLEELQPRLAPPNNVGSRDLEQLRAEFRGLHAGMGRVSKDLSKEGRQVEKTGIASSRFISLTHEWNLLSADYAAFVDRLDQFRIKRETRRMLGDAFQWEEERKNGYDQALQEWWDGESRNSRLALLKKWKTFYNHWSVGGVVDFHAKYADVQDAAKLPAHIQRAAVAERLIQQDVMRKDLGVWENPDQLHLFYTYGSVEKFVAAAREVIQHSGDYVTMADAHERGQQVLSSRQRKRNLDTARKGAFVDIVGKQIKGPHDVAQLLFPFRSPDMERFSVILTDDAGKVLAHTMESSGAINYSVIPQKLAKTIARRAQALGATRVHFGHNHPSGDPTPSTMDRHFTMEMAYQLKRRGLVLVDHVITNHKTYGWLKPGDDASRNGGSVVVGNALPYDVPALRDRSDWTQGHGGKVQAPIEVAGLAATALQGDDFGMLYLTSRGHTVALEPRPVGDLETIHKWIGEALKAHAADRVAIVYNPAEHGDLVDKFKDMLEIFPGLAHSVFDVVPFDGSKSLQEDAPHLLVYAASQVPLIPSPSKRLIGEEGRKGYGGSADDSEGEGEDRSEAAAKNDRRADASALPAEEGRADGGSSKLKPAELHDPQLERSGGVLARLSYEVRRLLTPAALTRESAQTARVLRAASGRAAHRKEEASHALRKFSRELTRLSPEKRMDFMHQIETGVKVTTTPGMAAAADMLRAELDRVRDRVRGLGTGKLENFIENYLPHIYKDPKRARTLIQQMMQRRPLEGNKSWLKKRSIPTLKDAMEIGLEPITDNPVDLALLRIYQMNKYVMAHEILQELKAKGPQFLKFVGAHEKPPIGYRPIDDSAFTVFGRPAVAVQEAFDPILRGHLLQILERLGGKHGRTINMREWGTAQGSQVKTKFGGDIGVLMHEIGHVLDTKFGVWDQLHKPIEERTVTRGKQKGKSVPTDAAIAHRVKVDAELRALADLRMEGQNPDDVAEHHKKYIRNRAEKIANAIHALVYMPDRMSGVAPTVKSALEQLLQGTPAADILNPKRGVALGTGVAEKGIYGTLITGKYYAPDAVATVVNNFLSGGLRGNPIYDAYMGIGNSLNQAQLGLSFFHLGFTSLDAMVSKLALAMQQTARGQLLDAGKSLALFPFAAVSNFAQGFQVYRAYLDPERAGKFDQVVKGIEMAGGKIKLDEFYRNDNWKKMIEGFYHKDPITVIARAPLAGFELSSRFILEFVVPRQKLGVFADMFMMEAKRLGPDATEDELRRAAQKAWDSTDNRMGQMVYDNLMWNRTLKDISMGLVRAVGWDLGTFRELIGGGRDIVKLPVKGARRLSDRRQKLLPRAEEDGQQQDRPDPLFTHKAAYLIALFAGVGMLGAALNKGMTGEWPQDMRDVWTPRTGKTNDEGNPERVELPSYVKDVFSYLGHGVKGTVQTALHKLHPMLNYLVSVMQNEDYYGNMIRNPDDDGLTQFKQEVAYAFKQWEPFGFRNAAEQAKRNQSRPVQIGNFIGITPAHRADTRTPAENKMADLLRAKGRSGLTPEEAEQRQVRGELRTAKRTGKPKGSAIADAMRTSPLSHRDAVKIWNDTGKSAQLEQFKRLDYLEAKQVMDLASAEEKRRWHTVFVLKRANYRAMHGAAAGR